MERDRTSEASAPVEWQPGGAAPATLLPVVAVENVLTRWRGLRRTSPEKDGFMLVPGYASAQNLLVQCRKMSPCILLIDENTLAQVDPWDLASAADYGRSIRILVVGSSQDERTIQSLVRMGCTGFLHESAGLATVKKAMRALGRGELWIGRRVTARVVQQLLCSLSSQKLTPREKEVLQWIARGLKNRAIAEKLSISHETVRWHIRSLHSKLGLQDRLGTALYAQAYLADQVLKPEVESGPSEGVGSDALEVGTRGQATEKTGLDS